MTADLRSAALACIKSGVSVIPIDHATKRPAANLLPREDSKSTWKPFQARIADEATVNQWFDSGIQSMAVVGGKVSGGLLILDFDVPRFYEMWVKQAGDLADGLPVQKTGGGGYHVFLRCPSPGGNDKLAWASDDSEATGRTIAIETRGEGGYVIVAPSLHPCGTKYEMIAGSLDQIPMVTQARAEALLAAAKALNEAPHTRQETERLESQARDSHEKQITRQSGQPSVIEAFNEAHSIEEVLMQHGYVKGSTGRLIRPGGSSQSVSIKDNRSCHWSTNDPLNDGKLASGCGVQDAFGIYCYFEHGGDVKKAVKAAAEFLGIQCVKEPPNCVMIDQYQPFPVEALPEPARSYVKLTAEALDCDPSYTALPLLSGLGSAIGNTHRIKLKDGWTEPPIVWTAIIGNSGTLKSPALEMALRPIHELQKRAMNQFKEASKKFSREKLRYEKELAAWKKPNAKESPPEEPEEPTPQRLCCDDTTVEALSSLLAENPRGLLACRDELSGWLGGFDRYSKGTGDVAKWLEMFGGRAMTIDRKGGEPKTLYIPHAAVSVAGGIQPEILKRSLREEYRENGLAARLLFAFPPPRVKHWTEACVDAQAENRIDDLFRALYKLESEFDSAGEPRPRVIPLAQDTKEIWIAFYNEHAREQAGLTGDLSAVWSKLEGYAARFALIIHLVRLVMRDPTLAKKDAVDAASVEAGIKLSQWFGYEAKRVYAFLNESEYARERRNLIELIQRKGGVMSPRELQQAKFRTAQDAHEALERLVEDGLGYWEEISGTLAGGRPTKKFHLVEPSTVYETCVTAEEFSGSGDADAEMEKAAA